MKKILLLALTAILAISFVTGCSKKTDPNAIEIIDGKKLSDVITAVDEKFKEKYGEDAGVVSMPMEIDENYLRDIVGLTLEDIDDKSGFVAMSMTNSDVFFGVKAKPDKTQLVKETLLKRKTAIEAQYETYNVMGSYDRAKAGEVYVKGDYVFLVIVGPAPENEEAPNFDEDISLAKKTIDSMFTK